MNVYVGLLALVLAIATVSAYPNNYGTKNADDWLLIPEVGGTFRMVHHTELAELSVPENFFNGAQDIIFTLFTRNGPVDGEVISLNNAASLAASTFNSAHQTKLTIHGWNGAANSGVNRRVAREHFVIGDFNMITVDWSAGSTTNNYITARNRVAEAGIVTASFIDFLNRETGIATNSVSVIGHSLGGHVAGVTGKNVASGRLNTIISLDPAGPLFALDSPDRVAPGDAEYVEVMHTNGWLLGFGEPIGDADFFPNGGRTQPGCGADVTGQCAHTRSWEYYAESISTQVGFWSTRCADFEQIGNSGCVSSGPAVPMGGEPSNNGRAEGVYWLPVNGAAPFARGN